MPRRTLAEELTELATTGPAPDLDPEADAFGEGAALLDSDDEAAAGADIAPARRLRGDIGDLGADVPGSESDTACRESDAEGSGSADVALIGAGEPGDESDESDGDMADSSGGDSLGGSSGGDHRSAAAQRGLRRTAASATAGGALSAEEDESDDAEQDAAAADADAALARMMAAAGGDEAAADADASAASSEGESDNTRQASPEPGEAAAQSLCNGELAALEREFDAVAEADAAAAAGLSAKAEATRRRGAAAGRQRRLWERALECRIRAQRAVAAAHRLPGPEDHTVATAASEPLSSAFTAASAAAAAALHELLALQDALVAQNPAITEAAEAAGGAADAGSRKRPLPDYADAANDHGEAMSQLWRRIEDGSAVWAPFRDASLDRWHRRAALGGGAAATRGGLKALAQPLSAQVAAALATPGRLLTRSQLPCVAAAPVLCEAPPSSDGAAGSVLDAAAGAGAADGGAQQPEQRRLAHTYDDADLYEQLLKEFLEGSGAPGGGGAALQRAPKRRKVVDRRASKGRRLRFHVHEKLVNFMTPVSAGGGGHPAAADSGDGVGAALFANLFGRQRPQQPPDRAAQLA